MHVSTNFSQLAIFQLYQAMSLVALPSELRFLIYEYLPYPVGFEGLYLTCKKFKREIDDTLPHAFQRHVYKLSYRIHGLTPTCTMHPGLHQHHLKLTFNSDIWDGFTSILIPMEALAPILGLRLTSITIVAVKPNERHLGGLLAWDHVWNDFCDGVLLELAGLSGAGPRRTMLTQIEG